ncbi:MAG: SDR family oxidoreductase [Chitinophagaceae bacterium]|nr:MAG: SDR family oxidoreductase [Chitinophagaceae bacterium]
MSKTVVLVTGTNSGFGWLIANSVAGLGHQVYATMRDVSGKNAEKAVALGQVENITVLDVTLTDDSSVQSAVDRILETEGRIDVLVNNAGFSISGVAESFTTADLQDLYDLNVIAPWRLMKQALPSMRAQAEGLIVNISSGFGRFSAPFAGMYASSKFALEGLSEGLFYEVRPLGVDVAIVQPGAYPTEIYQKTRIGADASVYEGYAAIMQYPDKMVAAIWQFFETLQPNPQDVADAIVGLIGMGKGERPLRTVVDPSTGEFVKKANEAVEVEARKGMKALGMEGLVG